MAGWASLLKSRKVLLAALGVVNTLVSYYLKIPDPIWQSIDALLGTLIVTIAAEDYAAKSGQPPTPPAA